MSLIENLLQLHHAWRQYQRDNDPLRVVLETLVDPLKPISEHMRCRLEQLHRVQLVLLGQPVASKLQNSDQDLVTGQPPRLRPYTWSMFVDAAQTRGDDRWFELQIPLRLENARLRIISETGLYVLSKVAYGQDNLLSGEAYQVDIGNVEPFYTFRVEWSQVRYGRDWVRRC